MVGWRRKLERREKAGHRQYLEAGETLEERTNKKLLEKTNWYKENKKRKEENQESQYKYNPPAKRKKRGQGQQKENKGMDKEGVKKKAVKAVMFVPYTKHSELASRLRDSEETMEKMTGYKLKIVEKGGTKLTDILHKVNPWAGQDCRRADACYASLRR